MNGIGESCRNMHFCWDRGEHGECFGGCGHYEPDYAPELYRRYFAHVKNLPLPYDIKIVTSPGKMKDNCLIRDVR